MLERIKTILIALAILILSYGVVVNKNQIESISGVYFDQSIIESIDALNYIPTELIDANVIVRTKKGSGSGSVIKIVKKGTYILTAAHVIYGQKIVRDSKGKLNKETNISRNITVIVNERKYKALPVKIDKGLDLAVLKIYKKLNIKPVKIAKSEPILGEIVWTISNPGGNTDVLNKGVFSSIFKDASLVATAGYFGSSGGMVLNTKGEQIGVISNVSVAKIHGYFPSITVYNGITRTKDLNKFLKGVL